MGDPPTTNLADQIGLTAPSQPPGTPQAKCLVVAVGCQASLRSALHELAAQVPDAALVLVSGTNPGVWEDSARALAEAAESGGIPVGFRGPPSRALVSALRRRRPGVALVLADEDRTPSRWGQVLGLLSGARRVWLLVGNATQVSPVLSRRILGVLARKLRVQVRESAAEVPLLGSALAVFERSMAAVSRRALPARARPADLPQARVLLVRSGPGASTRYRIDHKLEHLGLLGVQANARWFREYAGAPLLAARDASRHDLAIVHRIPHEALISPLLDSLTRLGRPVVYDIDDLIFAPEEVSSVPSLARRAVSGQADLLSRCTHVFAATPELAARAHRENRPAQVVANVLGRALLQDSYRARKSRRSSGELRLGYFSGSPTHDADVAVIAPALAEILDRHSHARLVLVGPVTLPEVLHRFGDRVEQLGFTPWRDLPALMVEKVDVNLAPLELSSPFCRAKSELKYVEAGAVGIPTVASPTPAFQAAISHGVNGFLAATADEWVSILESLASSPSLAQTVGAAAQQDVEERYSPQAGATRLAEALSVVLDLPYRACAS